MESFFAISTLSSLHSVVFTTHHYSYYCYYFFPIHINFGWKVFDCTMFRLAVALVVLYDCIVSFDAHDSHVFFIILFINNFFKGCSFLPSPIYSNILKSHKRIVFLFYSINININSFYLTYFYPIFSYIYIAK